MISLLDVNVLIALAWPTHVHHAAALRWFRANQTKGWATCPLTQSGFVRVSSNRRILTDAKSPREALLLLGRIVGQANHSFWSDDVSLTEPSPFLAPERLQGHRQVTDAHLLAIALRNKGRVATLDNGLRNIVPPGIEPEEAVEVIRPVN